MPDREKVIKGLEALQKSMSEHQCYTCSYEFIETAKEFGTNSIADALALLKEQDAKPPVHIHEEYPEHDWARKANGDIDDFAFEVDFHNGPMCERCGYSFCIHCDPDGWNKEPCIIDEHKCPTCGRHICKGTKFCSDCGQKVKWDDRT